MLMAFPYYGGKNKIGAAIRQILPVDCLTYVEPFAGSLGCLLNRPTAMREVASDLAPGCVAFWQSVVTKPATFRKLLRYTLFSKRQHVQAHDQIDAAIEAGDTLEAGRLWWVLCEQSFASLPQNTTWRSLGARSRCAAAMRRADDVIRVHQRVKRLEIRHADAGETLAAFRDDSGAVLYCDPPYQFETRADPREHYLAESSQALHEAIWTAATEGRARMAVSHYACDDYDRAFKGFWRVTFYTTKTVTNSLKQYGPDQVAEAVYCNFLPCSLIVDPGRCEIMRL